MQTTFARAHDAPAPTTARARAPLWRYAPPAQQSRLGALLAAAGVHAKMTVSRADDPCEVEADRMADHVMSGRASAAGPGSATAAPPPRPSLPSLGSAVRGTLGMLHRLVDPGGDDDDAAGRIVHTARELGRAAVSVLPRGIGGRIGALARGGIPLPGPVRGFMESRFGQDFSSVRVHTGEEPARVSESIHARAFAVGDHISFGRGQFQPHNDAGRRLIAHELAHVVQRRGPTPAPAGHATTTPAAAAPQAAPRGGPEVRRDAEDESALDAIGSFVGDQVWSIIREHAPQLEPIVRQGPFEYVKSQVAGAFDGLVTSARALLPAGTMEQLDVAFGALGERASVIVAALGSGDCGPLFTAITDIKTFVTEVAGHAWDGLVDLLRPVGDFFGDLWSSTGAPAIEWIQRFAGDVWARITALGQQIWDWTQPVRDSIGAAWEWLKEQLFGAVDAATESGTGFIDWILGKASEAWEAIKAETRPVWEPVAQAVETVRALIPPAFIRQLGEQFQNLGQSLNQAGGALGGEGEELANNREALAAALPTVREILTTARAGIVSAQAWLLETVAGLSSQVSGFLGSLRNSSLLSSLAGALTWLEELTADLGAWVQQGVGNLFGQVLAAFDRLAPFVERLAGFVQQVISVVGDITKLPTLVLGALWNLIPECIRNPVKDFLINQILRRIPVFSTLLELPDIWARVEAVAMRILRQVFVDGDLPGAAWTFFSNMLRLLGIPPELVVSILAKAATAIGDILVDPVGFLINLVVAVKNGFLLFFSNIGRHLLNGVTGWLFGAMRGAGITPPTELSLRAILGLVMQILDITVERVFERLSRKVSPAIVAGLRRALSVATGVWRFVAILVEEGPGGLWREIQERLSNLWSTVLNGVINWISTAVIQQAIIWLLGFLDISGIMPTINTLIAIYRAIQSVAAYIVELLQTIDRTLDGIVGIARGQTGPAAGFLESALAGVLPAAIGFLAYQLGLGNVSTRMREMMESVRAVVDAAIDWLIDRAIAGGQAIIDLIRRGVAAVRGGVAALREWWRATEPVDGGPGEQHTLYFEGTGANARLMMRSDPTPFATFVDGLTGDAGKKTEALGVAQELDQATHAAAGSGGGGGVPGDTTAPAAPGPGGEPAVDPAVRIQSLMTRLAALTGELLRANLPASTPPLYGPLTGGFGTSVRVEQLTRGHAEGSAPSADSLAWQRLLQRRQGGRSYYVRGHLLNNHLGGTGGDWMNLTPLFQDDNSLFEAQFESAVKQAVNTDKKKVRFIVTASYGRQPDAATLDELRQGSERDEHVAAIMEAERYVPLSLSAEATDLDDGTALGATSSFPSRAQTTNETDYDLEGAPRQGRYLSEMTAAQMVSELGIPEAVALLVQARAGQTGGRTWAALGGVPGFDVAAVRGSSRFNVRIYRRS